MSSRAPGGRSRPRAKSWRGGPAGAAPLPPPPPTPTPGPGPGPDTDSGLSSSDGELSSGDGTLSAASPTPSPPPRGQLRAHGCGASGGDGGGVGEFLGGAWEGAAGGAPSFDEDSDDDPIGAGRSLRAREQSRRQRTASYHEVDPEDSAELLEAGLGCLSDASDGDPSGDADGGPVTALVLGTPRKTRSWPLSKKTWRIVSELQEGERAEEEEEHLAAARERSLREERALSGRSSEAAASLRVLLLGDSGVGKTSLMLRYSEDKFAPSLLSTAGVDYKVRNLRLEGRRVRLQIWDTAGQEKFHVITRSYYKNAHGICLVYSVSDRQSFDNVRYWMANIKEHAKRNVRRVILANKSDLSHNQREVTTEMGEALAAESGDVFLETSALSGSNVAEAFEALAKLITEEQRNGANDDSSVTHILSRWRRGRRARLGRRSAKKDAEAAPSPNSVWATSRRGGRVWQGQDSHKRGANGGGGSGGGSLMPGAGDKEKCAIS